MELILAENIGFCFGVKRAYEMSLKTTEESNISCQMLGALVHNEKVIEDLEKRGLKFVSSLEEVKEKGTVIIRAHGVSDEVFESLKKKNVKIIDATCPFVKNAQNFARSLDKEGRKVVIIGEKSHAEVKAINGVIKNRGVVVESKEEILKIDKNLSIGIVAQTTQDEKKIKDFLDLFKKNFKNIKIHKTLCYAVIKRQKEVRKLVKKVDIVLVVGSKNSANTQRLIEIASEEKKEVYGVEEKESLKEEWFFKKEKVGLISGTSTPKWVIDEVIDELKKLESK